MSHQRSPGSILVRIGIICALLVLTLLPARFAAAQNPGIYVDLNGSDINGTGTSGAPYQTLQKALNNAVAGVPIYMNSGTYTVPQPMWWDSSRSGLASAWIVVQPAPNTAKGSVILECGAMATAGTCLQIAAQYVEVRGLEIRNARKSGISVWGGSHVRIANNSIHHSKNQGIYVNTNENGLPVPTDIVIDSNTIYQNAQNNNPILPGATGGWDSGIGISKVATSVRIINNRVYENYGEGIGISSKVDTVVRNNTIYDNFSVNLYINGASNVIAEQNLIYTRRNTTFFRENAPAKGISVANEHDTASTTLNNLTIQNNIVVGGHHAFYYGSYMAAGGMKNSTIAHNTFFTDAFYPKPKPDWNDSATVRIEVKYVNNLPVNEHVSTKFYNNAVMHTATGDIRAISPAIPGTSIEFKNNGWHTLGSAPSAPGSGPNDMTANPQFVYPGGITADSYKLLATSPLINAGAASPSATTNDFWGDLRVQGGVVDIGADEVIPLSAATPRFEAAAYRIDESGLANESVAQVKLKVILPAAQPTPITLAYSTVGGSAEAGADYQAVSGTILFPAGQTTSQTIIIPLLEDGLAEEDEDFAVRLSNGASAVVVIATNDKVTFSTWGAYIKDAPPSSGDTPDQWSVITPSPMVLVTMKLNAPSRLPVSVNIATRNGTSLAGFDYHPMNTTVTFQKPSNSYVTGTTSTSASVTIITDTINDDGEEFYIDALSATNAGIVQPSMVIITSNSGAQ
jgi:parallel beta-helix repeat protein